MNFSSIMGTQRILKKQLTKRGNRKTRLLDPLKAITDLLLNVRIKMLLYQMKCEKNKIKIEAPYL